MKISVIVPTYNRCTLLKRTLESLFRQTYSDYEIIVVNDGSTDGTDEYLQKLASQGTIKYVSHENSGLAATRKAGLSQASGEVIAFTDDDCVLPVDWLATIARNFEQTEVAGVGGATRTGNAHNVFAVTTDCMQNYFKQIINTDGVAVPFLTGNNVAYKRSILEKVGGPDSRFRMGAEDRDLTFRVAQTGEKLLYDPHLVVEHHNDSTFWKFLTHQYDFGRGSYLFYTQTRSFGKSPSRMPLSVYLGLFLFPFRLKMENALTISFLLFLSQIATTVGFFVAAISRKKLPLVKIFTFRHRHFTMAHQKDKRLTILFVNLYTEMGGGEYAIYNLVKEMDRSRFRPIMAFNRRGPFVEKVEAAGVETVILPYPSVMLKKLIVPTVFRDVLRASKMLKQYVREHKIDCLHCVDVLSLLLFARAILSFRIPLVYNVIFFYEWTRVILFNILALVLVKKIITNSQAIKNDLLRRTVFLSNKTQVVYYGIDVERFRPSRAGEGSLLRRELNLPPSTKLVGMIARYDVWKGHTTFLQAAASVLKKRNDVKFVIIGGLLNAEIVTPLKRYYQSVMNYRKSLGLENDVLMLPHRDDIPDVLRGLDVFICPSKREPIPLIVFEAMACGVPIVAADSGGIPEQIVHGQDGLLFRTDDAVSLEQAIMKILGERETSRRMAHSARKRIEEQFMVNRFVKEMERVYEESCREYVVFIRR